NEFRAGNRIKENHGQRTQRSLGNGKSSRLSHQESCGSHQRSDVIRPADNSQRNRLGNSHALKSSTRPFVMSSNSHDLHWHIALTELAGHLVHMGWTHPATHQQHDRTIVPYLNSLKGADEIESWIDGNPTDFDALCWRGPVDHFISHALVGNYVSIDFALYPD